MSGSLRPASVIVADDGSSDASAEVCERHGATHLAGAPGAPHGFAHTVNRGLAEVPDGIRWVLVLNNDTEVDPGLIAALVDAGRRYPEAAILVPIVRSLRERDRIDSAGLLLYRDGVARPRWHGARAEDVAPREEPVLLPSGTAFAVRREWLERLGVLDESLGSYVEDVDWGLRAARRGAIAMLVPAAVLYHHFGGTAGGRSAAKARLVERNRLIVAARHLPATWLVGSLVWTPRRWLALARSRGDDGGAWRAALLGAAEGLLALPAALAERRRLRREGLATGRRWRARLARHSCGLDAFARFGGD